MRALNDGELLNQADAGQLLAPVDATPTSAPGSPSVKVGDKVTERVTATRARGWRD